MKKYFTILLALSLMLSGCSKKQEDNSTDTSDTTLDLEGSQTSSDMFTDRDYRTEYDEADAIKITLNGNTASCDGSGVTISGSTITITKEATYIISGTLNDGMIIVDAGDSDKLQIVLDNVDITSSTSSPIYIKEADKVFITLASNSTNTLTNGGEFVAKQDVTFNGDGTLTINSPVGHGIVSKDDLVFTSGCYEINSASHGLEANNSVRLTQTTMTILAGKDGIHTENDEDESLGFLYIQDGNYTIEAEGDGLSAVSLLQIEGGTLAITTGGGSENGTKQTSDNWGGFMGGRGQNPMQQHQNSSSSTSSDDSTSIKGLKVSSSLLINGANYIKIKSF